MYGYKILMNLTQSVHVFSVKLGICLNSMYDIAHFSVWITLVPSIDFIALMLCQVKRFSIKTEIWPAKSPASVLFVSCHPFRCGLVWRDCRAFARDPKGHEFNGFKFWLVCFHVKALGRLLTCVYLCYQAV